MDEFDKMLDVAECDLLFIANTDDQKQEALKKIMWLRQLRQKSTLNNDASLKLAAKHIRDQVREYSKRKHP